MSKPVPHSRADYPHFLPLQTRWADNDVYGHINNAVYYFYFDTLVNRFLIDNDLLRTGSSTGTGGTSDPIGLVVETGCSYFAPLSFPDPIMAGLRVAKLGSSSVRYEIALFAGDETSAAAQGHFVHVYVDAAERRPVALSDKMRGTLSKILAP